jgi:hypothetical protein
MADSYLFDIPTKAGDDLGFLVGTGGDVADDARHVISGAGAA